MSLTWCLFCFVCLKHFPCATFKLIWLSINLNMLIILIKVISNLYCYKEGYKKFSPWIFTFEFALDFIVLANHSHSDTQLLDNKAKFSSSDNYEHNLRRDSLCRSPYMSRSLFHNCLLVVVRRIHSFYKWKSYAENYKWHILDQKTWNMTKIN